MISITLRDAAAEICQQSYRHPELYRAVRPELNRLVSEMAAIERQLIAIEATPKIGAGILGRVLDMEA